MRFVRSIDIYTIFVADILLFPMFHIGPLSIKPSYIILIWWLMEKFFIREKFDVEFIKMTFVFLIIMFCGILGEFWVKLFVPSMILSETIWSLSIYFLILLSFGFGLSAKRFNFKILVPILIISFTLNFLISIWSNYFTGLLNFYYSKKSATDLGVDDVNEIVNLIRPRGIFGNPNLSMLQVNIITLFIFLSYKYKILPKPSKLVRYLIMILPPILALLLGSRGELIVSVVYSTCLGVNFWGTKVIFRLIGIGCLFFIGVSVLLAFLEQYLGVSQLDVVRLSLERITKSDVIESEDSNQGISRPLILWEFVSNRFVYSPIFGTGFNATLKPLFPFNYSPRYYHNDWFRILITSGIAGFFSFVWLIKKYIVPISWILIVPFFLPGLTNSFILSIPTMMFYFFMLGIFNNKMNEIECASVK